jgi:hypothetical protein
MDTTYAACKIQSVGSNAIQYSCIVFHFILRLFYEDKQNVERARLRDCANVA